MEPAGHFLSRCFAKLAEESEVKEVDYYSRKGHLLVTVAKEASHRGDLDFVRHIRADP
jgi:hypothetical protein